MRGSQPATRVCGGDRDVPDWVTCTPRTLAESTWWVWEVCPRQVDTVQVLGALVAHQHGAVRKLPLDTCSEVTSPHPPD